jgi:hypothetical protein
MVVKMALGMIVSEDGAEDANEDEVSSDSF